MGDHENSIPTREVVMVSAALRSSPVAHVLKRLHGRIGSNAPSSDHPMDMITETVGRPLQGSAD